jgi:hypothetical protein
MPDFWLGNQITFDWQIKLLTTARISCFQFVSVHAAEKCFDKKKKSECDVGVSLHGKKCIGIA